MNTELQINPEAAEVLKKILSKQKHMLSQQDIDFLRARRDYLSATDLLAFADILDIDVKSIKTPTADTEVDEDTAPEEPQADEEVEQPKKKGKKK